MAEILTNKYKFANSTKILDLFSSLTDSVYCFIGKVSSWTDDNNPTAPINSLNDEITIWDDMVYANKISSDDASLVIPFVAWDGTGNSVYDPRQDNVDMTSKTWYFINPTSRCVYKCSDNNGNKKATTEPTGTGVSGIIHNSSASEDGYKWKFMYKASSADVSRFYTSDTGFKWFPVKQ